MAVDNPHPNNDAQAVADVVEEYFRGLKQEEHPDGEIRQYDNMYNPSRAFRWDDNGTTKYLQATVRERDRTDHGTTGERYVEVEIHAEHEPEDDTGDRIWDHRLINDNVRTTPTAIRNALQEGYSTAAEKTRDDLSHATPLN